LIEDFIPLLPLGFEYLVALQIPEKSCHSRASYMKKRKKRPLVGVYLLLLHKKMTWSAKLSGKRKLSSAFSLSLSLVHSSNMDSVLNVTLGK